MSANATQTPWVRRQALSLLGAALTLGGLFLASRYNYLLFHCLAELFAVVIGCGIFMVAWNSRQVLRNGYLLLLGIAWFFVAILDLCHALAYKGMAIFPGDGANRATQLWLAARYVESFSLLTAPLLLRRPFKPGRVALAYALVTLLLLLSIFATRWFPDCYVAGAGLTPFKRLSEYVICLVLAAAAVLLHREREAFDPEVRQWLAGSLGLTIISELAFTLYVDVYGVANLLGHYLKILAFYCLYRAIIETGLRRPLTLLLREVTQSERQFRIMGETVPYGVWLCGPDGGLRYCSQSFLDLLNLAPEEAQALGWTRRLAPGQTEPMLQRWADCRARGAPWEHELHVVDRHGHLQTVLVKGLPVRDADGQIACWVGVHLDINERKKFQTELERLVAERTAKLEEMVRELEHFSYSMIHDLRAPLRAMHGFAELAAEACLKCPQSEPKDYLRRILVATQRMDTLITDALHFNQTVRQELPLTVVDVDALLRGMLDSYPDFQPDRARIRLEGELPRVLGNQAGLTQCFSNLLGNAVKFVAPGTTPEVRVRAESCNGRVRIWIEDNGVGIPKTMLPRVFNLFVRGHNDHEGTGIGLALVRKIVERMGGTVGAESEPGRGSRFWLELRRAR